MGDEPRRVEDPKLHTVAAVGVRNSIAGLTVEEELRLHQLLQRRYWFESRLAPPVADASAETIAADLPVKWELTRGLTLHEWQRECVDKWFSSGRRGVLKVVTGAGKTAVGLAIAERLRNVDAADLHVAIVVPTVVLLGQWLDELRERSNLPPSAIGSIGGGRSDRFGDGVRVLVCVINSASKKLPAEVSRAQVGDRLLLVVDECHRAGASEMRRVLDTPRAFSLGLSATPERDDDPSELEGDLDAPAEAVPLLFDETVLGQALGPVVYELNYAQAIERGVLPPFRIVHYGLSLNQREREIYERISREIKDLRSELETANRRGLALIRWCRSKGAAANPKAQRLLAFTSERKRMLYRISERSAAVEAILQGQFASNSEAKAILFHESIDEVMSLFSMLGGAGLAVVAEHSEFPDAMRTESLRLFRRSVARVIVSARSLIEGFNVPAADVGIIVAASSSVRQRVQTLGRLLRKSTRADGEDKQATLFVLYAANTVDELVYEKADWERLVGAERNEYFVWNDVQNSSPSRQPGPPRRPLPNESAIDAATLSPGGVYPGDPDEGRPYSQDTQGTVRNDEGCLIQAEPELLTLLKTQGRAGRFRVTPRRHFVTKLEKTSNGWRTVYLGQLRAMPEVAADREEPVGPLTPGDRYPLGRVKGRTYSVLQRDRRLIAEKTHEGVRFVLPPEALGDETRASALRDLLQRLAAAKARGHRISKITVTDEGHVVYVFNSVAYFVGLAPEGAVGFQWDELSRGGRR